MASFPRLEGLVVAASFRSLFDRIMLYFKKESLIDLNFAANPHNLWVQFIDRTNDRKLFINELYRLPPSLMSYMNDDVKFYLLWYYVHVDDEVGTWHPEVPNTTIKLLLFPFSLQGEARTWLDKEPPRSIITWEDLVLKFINQFFPPSKTTYLRNEIINFLQKPNETFNEAWERFKDLLRQCPHHGFSELHQLDTFYNALNPNDQDALDSAA
nr:reverse transcriptase domain-containing protein [Tanacetum cinerariifolium]